MLKKTLLTLAVVIAVVNTIIAGYEYVWPFIDTNGVIETGEYRGLRIGDSKADVIRKTTNPAYTSKLKIVAYRGPDDSIITVFKKGQPYHLQDSNTWFLFYPSIHKETIALSFENGRLYKISYQRDMLSP